MVNCQLLIVNFPNYFFGTATFGATYPGVALKAMTGLPSEVLKIRTSPLAAPPATSVPSGLIETAYTMSVKPGNVLIGAPVTGFQSRTVMSALHEASSGFFASAKLAKRK